MKLPALILLLLSQSNSFSQMLDDVSLKNKALFDAVAVVVTYKENDSIKHESGMGFVINGKYVATCYHIYKPTINAIPIKVEVWYNYRVNGSLISHDSTLAENEPGDYKNKYNFRKHRFVSDIPNTDFIILPLKEKINQNNPLLELSDAPLNVNDSYATIGFASLVEGRNDLIVPIPRLISLEFRTREKGGLCILFMGKVMYGFSGGPVYNNYGKVIGINFAGFDTQEMYESWIRASHIPVPPQTHSEILGGYAGGFNLSATLPIGELYSLYLKGYLDDIED